MADDATSNGTEAPAESPQSRLRGAGFTNEMGFLRDPNGERLFRTEDAVAALDSGEIQPGQMDWPGVYPDTAATIQAQCEAEMYTMLRRNPPEPEPPPLPSWAEPWAEMVAAKLKPIIRAENRRRLRGEVRV